MEYATVCMTGWKKMAFGPARKAALATQTVFLLKQAANVKAENAILT